MTSSMIGRIPKFSLRPMFRPRKQHACPTVQAVSYRRQAPCSIPSMLWPLRERTLKTEEAAHCCSVISAATISIILAVTLNTVRRTYPGSSGPTVEVYGATRVFQVRIENNLGDAGWMSSTIRCSRFTQQRLQKTGPDAVEFEGDFTIRGVTKKEKLTFQVTGKGTASGSINGVTAFDRKEY